jgi:hypothetical protein
MEPQFDLKVLTEEDMKLVNSGIPVSESEDDFSESASVGLLTPEPNRYMRGVRATYATNAADEISA